MTSVSLQKPSKVSIIGTGRVGSTYAFTLLLRETADEICLIDDNKERALGESMDLNHAMSLVQRTTIWAGSIQDVVDSDLVAICAGSAQQPGETRMDLIHRNAKIVGDIAEKVGQLAPNAILLVVTNPVDVMSYVAMMRSGLAPQRVIGSGTMLDTARLRYVIGESWVSVLNTSMHPSSANTAILKSQPGQGLQLPEPLCGIGLYPKLISKACSKKYGTQRIISSTSKAPHTTPSQ